jgi:hypothetical protein
MDDSISAVVAHGLLNSLAVVKGGTAALARAWDELPAEHRRDALEMALSQAELMADGLDALPSHTRHRLANHLFVVRGVCETLIRESELLPAAERADLLGVVQRQAGHAAGVLEGVARALPTEVQSLLNDLDDRRDDSAVSGVLG